MHLRSSSPRVPFGAARPPSTGGKYPGFVPGGSPTQRAFVQQVMTGQRPMPSSGSSQPASADTLVNYRPPASYEQSQPGGMSAFQAGETMFTSPMTDINTVSNTNAPLGPNLDPSAAAAPESGSGVGTVVAGLAVLALVGGAAWYFTRGKK